MAWKDLSRCINRGKELGQCYYWSAIIRFELGDKEKGCKDMWMSAQNGYEIDEFYKEHCGFEGG